MSLAEKGNLIWRELSIQHRADYVRKFVDAVVADTSEIANEITWQMGRPISQSPWEIGGFADRAKYMIAIAEEALDNQIISDDQEFKRWMAKVPLGILAVLSPWNYPFLTSVNAIVPALIAGNSVVLKHSFQTPLVAERYMQAAEKAGFPTGVFQILHLNQTLAYQHYLTD